MIKAQKGQSIIEIAVAGGALMLGLVSVISAMVVALRGSSFSTRQTLATQQAQQVMEGFLQFRRSLGWESFYETLENDGNNFSYCVQTQPTTETQFAAMTAATCTQTAGSTAFTKQMDVTLSGGTEVDLIVHVKWYEGTQIQEVTVTQKLKQY